MTKTSIYNNNGIVKFSTLGMKTHSCYGRGGHFHSFIRNGFSLGILYSSSAGYLYRFYSTNTSIITTRSTVKIVPAATYLNPDTQKLAILNENKNKGGVYR